MSLPYINNDDKEEEEEGCCEYLAALSEVAAVEKNFKGTETGSSLKTGVDELGISNNINERKGNGIVKWHLYEAVGKNKSISRKLSKIPSISCFSKVLLQSYAIDTVKNINLPPYSTSPAATMTLTESKNDSSFSSPDLSCSESISSDNDSFSSEGSISEVFTSSCTHESSPFKPKRKRASRAQLDALNELFQKTSFPSTAEREALGKKIAMRPRTVQIWFQNKRQGLREAAELSRNNS